MYTADLNSLRSTKIKHLVVLKVIKVYYIICNYSCTNMDIVLTV